MTSIVSCDCRCDTLIRLIEKEMEDAAGGAKTTKPKKEKAEPISRDGSVVPTGGEGPAAAAGAFSTGRKRKMTAAGAAMAEGGDGQDDSPGGGSGGGKKSRGTVKV